MFGCLFVGGGGCESCKSTQSKNNLIAAGADHSRSTFQLIRFFFSFIFKRQRREFVKNLFAGRMCLTSIQFTNPVELGKYFCYDPISTTACTTVLLLSHGRTPFWV